MKNNHQKPRTLPTATQIIYRASTSILREKPRYTKEDKVALSILSEYGI